MQQPSSIRERTSELAELDRQIRLLIMERDCGSVEKAEALRRIDSLQRDKLAITLQATIEAKQRLIDDAKRHLVEPLAAGIAAGPAFTMVRIRRAEIKRWQQEIDDHRATLLRMAG